MHSSIFTAFIGLVATSLALPTASPSALPTTTNFTVRAFYASLAAPDAPVAYQQQSWADFIIDDGDYNTLCTVMSKPNEALYSTYKYYPCEKEDSDPDVSFSFRISKNFRELEVKKTWNSNGTYLTGFATQETHWKEGESGNVTVSEYGKLYQRFGMWNFEITRLIG
ncbi:uncharacterized protein K460DRAFT_181988 [Cucurbitaria berberidis CBS 394.84]|uniref:AA1-like domain-containing protein n=1 Tax=Cucurbitaria berberidis CBS 394.84 TaxID=1168544 RepID=A0A9P4L5G6_9PLEO|nr:uncharacterized protein K460DRAFT_181988 [Cucurbitaria berberidis CBS 394.84]KAF1842299.1 hypothetical protein K460DRAFT_181988 [Cucurbitaria berberidis CBS 394.84]